MFFFLLLQRERQYLASRRGIAGIGIQRFFQRLCAFRGGQTGLERVEVLVDNFVGAFEARHIATAFFHIGGDSETVDRARDFVNRLADIHGIHRVFVVAMDDDIEPGAETRHRVHAEKNHQQRHRDEYAKAEQQTCGYFEVH